MANNMDRKVTIRIADKHIFGGRIVATIDNKEVGWLRYHNNLDDKRKVEISVLEILEKYAI